MALFQENWNGSSIDTLVWNINSGSYTVSSNNLTGYYDIDTIGKKFFTCGKKTIIEFATTCLNNSQDIQFSLQDISNSSNKVGFYCNENFYNQGIRIDFQGSFGSGYTNTGGDVITKQYYKITLEGTSVSIEQGSSYGTVDRSLTRTASITTEGKSFYILIRTDNGGTGTGTFFPINIYNSVKPSLFPFFSNYI